MKSSPHEHFRRYLKNNFFGRNFGDRAEEATVEGLIDCVDYALNACDFADAQILRDGEASDFLEGLDDPILTGCELVELGRLIMAYARVAGRDELYRPAETPDEREKMLASQLAGERELAKLEAAARG
ncbi:hypothetical protein J2045_002148 [Peteryoungia aggregata LMG 23059]|uniref:Uncharacterized protein n=1 Tax=Peteryoungia aggregata LMG 23059 TaxID=1368425 RepID=A0ABU0G713_9HYPH|nr:hypothetical protein [Peteryoungia aggregata]MDQ0421121.1 hypothetical protein [Peteryoungia aggregata LMG 23059]